MDDLAIVVIDDEALITDVLKAFMERRGDTVYDFNDAYTALNFIEQHHRGIHAVVTDYKMPGQIDGGDVYRHIKTNYPTIVCYVITGYMDVKNNDIDDNFIIDKPIDFNTFLPKLYDSIKKSER